MRDAEKAAMKRTNHTLVITTLVGLALSCPTVAQETVTVFRPEISLTLTCQGGMAGRQHALQRFLRAHGFMVLDLSHSNYRSGSIFPQNSELIGIDAQHRIAELASSDPPDTSTFALILTAPPSGTRGTTELRDLFERFARKDFRCDVRSVRYGHNYAEMSNAYDEWARRIAGAMRGAPRS
jgi:hypothetical protein